MGVACLQRKLFMDRTIPDARPWLVPRANHPTNLEEPDAYDRALLEFSTEADTRN